MDNFFLDLSGGLGDSFSDPIIQKAKDFKKELELINKKYNDFFNSKTSSIPNQQFDSIFNHCKIYIGYDPVKFFFTDDVVPKHIQKECFDVFKKVFE
jgi:hypothetical protein